MSTTKEGLALGQLEFTVDIKPDPEDLTAPAGTAVQDMKTPGVILQNGVKLVEGVDKGLEMIQEAADDVTSVENGLDTLGAASESVEAVVSPLVDNMKTFVDLVETFSKVRACDDRACKQLTFIRSIHMPKLPGKSSRSLIRYVVIVGSP